ncbi:MAG TPA: VTT domain-containing protein [Candidatus Paceibacterota bacterium]|nr:VTT domain-containing protein [Candidatus Paceibacterota bacterium]
MERRKLLLLIVVVILAAAVWSSSDLARIFDDILEASERIIGGSKAVAGTVFLALNALSAMFAFFSSVILVPVAIHNFGVAATFVLLMGGWVLGGVATYFVGEFWGRPVLKYFFRKGTLERYEDIIVSRLNFFMVLLFRLAMPAEIPGYLLGVLRYDFKNYIAATTLAELPFALSAVYGSELFLNDEKSMFLGVVVVMAAVFAVALYIFRRKTLK